MIKARHTRLAAGLGFVEAMPAVLPHSATLATSAVARVPAWKRVLDMGCILVAMPGLLLVMGFIAALIKTVSPGPVFFRQERVGHGRRRFVCLKFRTMEVGADAGRHRQHLLELLRTGAPLTKLDVAGDPRLIRYGALLRATGLDELPQLINVWRGEMSLVGPRPCVAYEMEACRPWQYARFDTLPGLTGLWQVSGKNRTTFAEMLNLDIQYVRHRSPWLDLKIMARTVGVMVRQVRELGSRRHQSEAISCRASGTALPKDRRNYARAL